jgi:ABC-type transporter Mla subunit MlaD
MDLTEYPSLGRLAFVNAQLATQNRQVAAVINSQLDEVELLFRAAAECDWDVVLRVSESLSAQSTDRIDRAVVRTAQMASEALRRDPTSAQASRRVAKLLSACREAQLKK